MQIRLKKGRDGPDSLACVRDDGTSRWKRLQRGLAFHDLAHYAVESELAIADGFFGLVESGWTFDELVAAEERSRIPPAAVWVEFLVNAFLTEAMSGAILEEDAFHESVVQSATKIGVAVPRRLDAEEIARIRGRIIALVGQWRALPLSETLALDFEASRAKTHPGSTR